MKTPNEFEFNIGFDEDQEVYFVFFQLKDQDVEVDKDIWEDLSISLPPGFWKLDEESYEFLMQPHEAIEALKRYGFVHNLSLV